MHKLNKLTLSACLGLILGIGQAAAGAKPDQAHRLSEDSLTPMAVAKSRGDSCLFIDLSSPNRLRSSG